MREVGPLTIEQLRLDPDNPRIPESLRDEPQDVLLTHLFENDVLDELAASFLSNGYFDNEPILVLPHGEDGGRIVVEGNRRTGTLMILLQTPVAIEAGLSFNFVDAPTPEQFAALNNVPAFEVSNRAEVSAYLGYRHIGGLRQWPAEAKARFVVAQVDRAERDGLADPFYQVGRVIGSNARGVRSNYETLEILRFAQQELSFDTSRIREKRFTVWGLLMNNGQVREFINYTGRPRELADVKQAINNINEQNLLFVLEDLIPGAATSKAVLTDSRVVSAYADVLADEQARKVLEQFNDLSLAISITNKKDVASKLDTISRQLEALLVDASKFEITRDAVTAIIRVRELAQSLEAVLASKASQ